VEGDNRPFAQVKIEDLEALGLLDSGSSVSLLGEGFLETVERLGLRLWRSKSIMKSAGGTQHRVEGKIQPSISYNGLTHRLPILLCPSLKKKLYLGIDFWRKFELAPKVVGVKPLHQVESEFMAKGEPIFPEQTEKLEEAKGRFLTHESQGLGLTKVEEHANQLVEGAVPVKSMKCYG